MFLFAFQTEILKNAFSLLKKPFWKWKGEVELYTLKSENIVQGITKIFSQRNLISSPE